ncbi:MAG: PAS domain-containing sensor histidine kinase [Bdellovibrionales bacterium]
MVTNPNNLNIKLDCHEVFQILPDPVIVIDGQGQIVMTNKSIEEVLGHSPDEIVGQSINILMGAEDASHHDSYIAKYLQTGKRNILNTGRQVFARRKDGEFVSVYLRVYETQLEGEKHFVGLLRNLTEEEEAKGKLDSILKATPANILFLSKNLEVDYWNHFTPDLLEDDYLNRPIVEVVKNIDKLELLKLFDRHQWDSKTYEAEVLLFDPSEKRTMHFSVNPIMSTPGSLMFAVLITDITYMKRMKADAELASRLLHVDHLVSGVSHEINNPLTIVYAGLSRIKKKVLGEFSEHPKLEKLLSHLENTTDAVDRIKNVVHALRGFSRSTYVKDVADHCNIANVIEEILHLIRRMYEVNGININFQHPQEIGHVKGSKEQIQTIVMNLLSNAKDAMENSSYKKLSIELTELKEEVRLVVTDTGHGISDEIGDKVFNHFFTTRDPGQGTGLGLTLTHGIVKEIGGDISFQAANKGGTRFIVKLQKMT